MAAIAFIAGILLTLAFHELDLIRSRGDGGKFRKRSPKTGWFLMGLCLGLIALTALVSRH